jgi:hypothetical protein
LVSDSLSYVAHFDSSISTQILDSFIWFACIWIRSYKTCNS